MIPAVQTAMKKPSNFGLTALRSIIMDGRESVVTPIMKLSTELRTLGKQCFRNGDGSENVGVHRNTNHRCQNYPDRIAAPQHRYHLAFRNPVVNDRSNAYADENVWKYLLEGFCHLILCIGEAFLLCQRRRVNI